MINVACLVCTNRLEWKPWFKHQIEKQSRDGINAFAIVDSGPGGIASKRSALLERARVARAHFVAWFDDDDWSSPDRIAIAVEYMRQTDIVAVGNASSWFVDSRVESARRPPATQYQAPEGIIFNGAVFLTGAVPSEFDASLTTGEDTEWLARWMRHRPNYVILGEPMHIWLCHNKNVTNRANTRTFDQRLPPGLIKEEEWKLVPR